MDKLKIEVYPPRPNHMRTIYDLSKESRAHQEAAREAIAAAIPETPYSGTPLYRQDPLPPDTDTVPATSKIEDTPKEVPFVWKRK